MKDSGKKIKCMDKDVTSGQMAVDIMETGATANAMAMGKCGGPTAHSTMESGSMTRDKVKAQ